MRIKNYIIACLLSSRKAYLPLITLSEILGAKEGLVGYLVPFHAIFT